MQEKILLVDDEAGIRTFLGLSLADLGYDVHTAENGAEGLKLFRQTNPPLVLTDIKMPVMDGIELLRNIKEESPDTEVIIITGHGDMDLAVQSLKHGASDFITKPINDDILESALSRVGEKMTMRRRLRRHTEELEELVQEKSARLKQLFDVAPCYITVQDRDFTIVDANQRFREDFGDEVGSPCFAAYKHRIEPCKDCPVARTFADGRMHEVETAVTTLDGHTRNILVRTAPIRDVSGEVSHVMEMAVDISEIRDLQDQLASLGLMIGSMSHGVKGQLMALEGGIYRVDTGLAKNKPERVQAGWEVVKRRVENIKDLVLDILYFAKSRELELEKIDVADLAADLSAIAEPRARSQNVTFQTEISARGTISCDAKALSAALVNLLENAVDACALTPDGEKRTVTFRILQQEEAFRFEVEDTGPGIDRETREKMFTLFFSSKGAKGTGLGLFIANKVVRQHGGGIDVQSTLGMGTRFTVTLPAEPPESLRQGEVEKIV